MIGLFKEGLRSTWMLITADLTTDERRGAWVAVTRTATVFVGLLMIIHMLWAQGVFTYFDWGKDTGFISRVKAEEEIEKKVKDEVTPLKEDVATLKNDVSELKDKQEEIARNSEISLKLHLEREIRDVQRQYCDSDPRSAHRRLIVRNRDSLQEQYRTVNRGNDYRIPECSDL